MNITLGLQHVNVNEQTGLIGRENGSIVHYSFFTRQYV